MQAVSAGCRRLALMMQRSSRLEMSAWARGPVAPPTYGKPNTEQKSRITFALHGNILLPCEDEVVTEHKQRFKDAVAANTNYKKADDEPDRGLRRGAGAPRHQRRDAGKAIHGEAGHRVLSGRPARGP
ncbi:unnamed protein product [Prorocentrum cordatum]|uniref:Uncharacterized protein n=1 Tax=Prorocentrum cordatum TaxID=2364126 RepID=A0ABN9W8X5_9DINO|nr:unnamed protein product [Polarella glacialis]